MHNTIIKFIKNLNLEFEINYSLSSGWEWGYHLLLPTLPDSKSHYFAIGCIFIYWNW